MGAAPTDEPPLVWEGTLRISDQTGRRTVGWFSNLILDNASVFREYFGVDLYPGSLNVNVPEPPNLQNNLDVGSPKPAFVIPKSRLVGMPGYIGDGQAWTCTLEGRKFPEPIPCWVFRRIGSRVPHGVIEIVAVEGLVKTYGLANGDAVRIRL